MSAPATAVTRLPQKGTQVPSQQNQQQAIANLAYALWQQRGSPQGSPEQDWIEAEQQLRNQQSVTSIGL